MLALSDIKLAHSVFALPFAVLGAVMAAPATRGLESPPNWGRLAGQISIIVVCMFFARTWAMLVNRIADWRFDAMNPRTAGRAIASGRLAPRSAIVIAGAFGILFCGAAALFGVLFENWWPLVLSLPVLAWIGFYSFTKRFTALCHVFLGGALAASPLAAAVALDPAYLLSTQGLAVWLLAAMVLLWVAGFDVLYALQDVDFDVSNGLSSVPARVGWRGALWVSRALHVGAAGMLVWCARTDARFGAVFACGVGLAIALLVIEHIVVWRRGIGGLLMAFFTVNGVLSVTLGALGIADLLVT